jgi:hypothetical protein
MQELVGANNDPLATFLQVYALAKEDMWLSMQNPLHAKFLRVGIVVG